MATVAATEGTPVEPRPLRADARRNRERVLVAAREVFAVQGHEAQMDEIARSAQVGVGTVYRHFPTKEALIEALVADSFERLAEAAAAAIAIEDPWTAFAGVLRHGGELLAANRGLSESLALVPGGTPPPFGPVRALTDHVGELIRRGQAAGVIRPDLIVEDIPMLMCGIGAATRKAHPAGGRSWERHLAIVLDGLRAPAATGQLPD